MQGKHTILMRNPGLEQIRRDAILDPKLAYHASLTVYKQRYVNQSGLYLLLYHMNICF